MIFECQNRVAHKKDCNSYVFYAPINTLETLDPTNLTFWPHKIDQRTGISAAEICKESRVVPGNTTSEVPQTETHHGQRKESLIPIYTHFFIRNWL